MGKYGVLLAAVCLAWLIQAPARAAALTEGAELLGTQAPSWEVTDWVNSRDWTLSELRGSVVLVRWWTGPECPYCAAAAPSLNALHERYHAKGLVVIGLYHHKSPTPLTREHVERLVERYRFQFPVAVDPEWQTLKRWWLDDHEHAWTSVSFLIDQEGVIRYIHPGGAYTEADAATLTSLIEEWLAKQ